MRWARFKVKDTVSFGIVEGDKINSVDGSPFTTFTRSQNYVPLNETQFLPPVLPPTIYCAGHNYRDHIFKSAKRKGIEPIIPKSPEFAYRAINALIGHDNNVQIPSDSASHSIHYEPELVVVIGKKAKNVSIKEAKTCIFGYTIGNDISDRDWQKKDRTNWRSKNMDTFKPMGPWIDTEVNLDAMTTIVRLNGEIMNKFKTYNVLFNAEACISALSRYVTLAPGDVIWMGSEGDSPDVQSGDINEIEITGIGVLRNKFVLEESHEK
jgi:2-keto-4-pentenoate hydratase/2-oxohepta-3-ene-1,7-dioic acid hydratase in catechol pathway